MPVISALKMQKQEEQGYPWICIQFEVSCLRPFVPLPSPFKTRPGVMAQEVKYFLSKHRESKLDYPELMDKWHVTWQSAWNPRTWGVETGDSQSKLATWTNQKSEFLVQGETLPQRVKWRATEKDTEYQPWPPQQCLCEYVQMAQVRVAALTWVLLT